VSELASTKSEKERGWPNVAALMARDPGMGIFRRFRKLNALKLLEMQSHLAEQEEDYERCRSLCASNPATQAYQTDWKALDESLLTSIGCQAEAWRKTRKMLDRYSMSIMGLLIKYRSH